MISLVLWKIEKLYQPLGFEKFNFAGPPRKSDDNNNNPHSFVPNLKYIEMFSGNTENPNEINHDNNMNQEADTPNVVVNNNEDNNDMEVVKPRLLTQSIQNDQILSVDSLIEEFTEMLLFLGHQLSTSPTLFTKICRLIRSRMDILDISTFDSSKHQVDFESLEVSGNEILNIYRIVAFTLLPSLSRIDCNPAISALCWGVVSQFPFQTRFAMYGIWKGDGLAKQVFKSN